MKINLTASTLDVPTPLLPFFPPFLQEEATASDKNVDLLAEPVTPAVESGAAATGASPASGEVTRDKLIACLHDMIESTKILMVSMSACRPPGR